MRLPSPGCAHLLLSSYSLPPYFKSLCSGLFFSFKATHSLIIMNLSPEGASHPHPRAPWPSPGARPGRGPQTKAPRAGNPRSGPFPQGPDHQERPLDRVGAKATQEVGVSLQSCSELLFGSQTCQFSSVQFNSVAQSCPTLCNPVDCSTPGFPVHHQFPEFTQTHVY